MKILNALFFAAANRLCKSGGSQKMFTAFSALILNYSKDNKIILIK
jgi:hypothetical protein